MLSWAKGQPIGLSPQSSAPGLLPVCAAGELLAQHTGLIKNIRQLVGVPVSHWEALYLPLLTALADFAQSLPASEAHHHADAGGLLRHCLETAHRALTIRRGMLLPHGASAEDISRLQDVWTYATASAALLHDLGKPLVDQRVQLYDRNRQPIGAWKPLQGPMRATAYRVEFVRDRKYRFHSKLPPLLVHHLVPDTALQWLADDSGVFDAWLATISGEGVVQGGELYRIVRLADGESAAADLSGGHIQRTPASQTPSLAERLTTGLRHLVDSGVLPLNRPGAAGFVTSTDLWLVSKRALDLVRDHLVSEGQAGIPTRNERLMDELQQRGVLTPNGDRAVWIAQVSSGAWSSELSLLRIPLTRIWPKADSRPPLFDGAVAPGSDTAHDSLPSAPANSASGEPLNLRHPSAPDLAPAPAPSHPEEPDTGEVSEQNPFRSALLEKSAFLQWVTEGVLSGRLKTNAVDARVHFVAEGMLLVSPGVFRDFANLKWDSAQKELLKLKCHRKRPDGTNIWTYRVHGENRARGLLKGILIPDSESLGIIPPRINPHLRLEAASEPAAAVEVPA